MQLAEPYSFNELKEYLLFQENIFGDFDKIEYVLNMPRVILEIGCGTGDAARQIALNNPDIGVIASDKFDWCFHSAKYSHYQRVAMDWKEKKLPVQKSLPENLILIRAETNIIRYFPDHSIDTVLLMNPEPKVAESSLLLLSNPCLFKKLKPGVTQILVIPFSRQMGLMASGSFEFDHSEHCPRGIGYITSGPFAFRKGLRKYWGLDLSRLSGYSKNSAISDVFIFGNRYIPPPVSFWDVFIKKIFL